MKSNEAKGKVKPLCQKIPFETYLLTLMVNVGFERPETRVSHEIRFETIRMRFSGLEGSGIQLFWI